MPNDEKIIELNERSVEERIRGFSDLLNTIESMDEKKSQLWREIYENAISDRQNAYVMFSQLTRIVDNKSTEHAVHGRTIATFLERMSKSNDQLIKLAELIAKAQGNDETINPEEMFEQIKGNGR